MTEVSRETLETISDVVIRQLDLVRIVRVEARHDVDWEGDRILRIYIVFDSENGRLNNPKAVRSLGRHLRNALEKIGVDDFPMFNFATVEEDRTEAA